MFETDFGRVCCAICFDLNYLELRDIYAAQKPDLIIFSSMYHGGIVQQEWAYNCRVYFAGAIGGDQSRILNPFGEERAASTNYQDYITGRVGAVMLTYEDTDRTVMDIIREFDIMLLDDYFAECRRHRREHI